MGLELPARGFHAWAGKVLFAAHSELFEVLQILYRKVLEDLGVEPCSQNLHLQIVAAAGKYKEAIPPIPNYFGSSVLFAAGVPLSTFCGCLRLDISVFASVFTFLQKAMKFLRR